MINLPSEYKERPMSEDVDLVTRCHGRFKGTGLVIPLSQRNIYKNLTKFFLDSTKAASADLKRIWQPTVVDVGCGLGIGANIMSQEAKFVWGIDSNEESINYAKQMFERQPNHIYYTPQLTFDVVNAMSEPREMKYFDYVTCVEVIEHIPRTESDGLITFLNRFVKKDKNGNVTDDDTRTKIFITSPNRNSPHIQKDTPKNEHHCYEATAGEMYEYLITKYKYVTVYDELYVPQELNTEATPLVFKCESPI